METLIQLKAKAYDLFAQLEFIQGELRKVNQQIAELRRATLAPKPKTEEKLSAVK